MRKLILMALLCASPAMAQQTIEERTITAQQHKDTMAAMIAAAQQRAAAIVAFPFKSPQQ